MKFKMASPLCLTILFMITGALGNKWSVRYRQKNLCSLKGSTVFMNITYTHPKDLTVVKTFWLIDPVFGKETDLLNEPGYSGRVEYLGDEERHSFLRLSDVKKTDEHRYCFRIITNKEKENWLGEPGVILTVTDLQVIAPTIVTEGQSAIVICNTTCSLTDPTFIWYKNSHNLIAKTIKSNEVHLQPVSSEDAGSYSCAVRGYEHLPSPAHTLRVRYAPKNVSVSIGPSGDVEEDSPVTLTCSSDANPPVENYTWFKVNEFSAVGFGQSYRALQSGQYYCEAQNKHGSERSAAVSVTLNGGSEIVFVSVGIGLFGLATLLCALFWLRCKRQKKMADEAVYQNIGINAKDMLTGQTSNYQKPETSYPSPPDSPTSSDYQNITTLRNMLKQTSAETTDE